MDCFTLVIHERLHRYCRAIGLFGGMIGADMSMTSNGGLTVLNLASSEGHLDEVRLMLTEGVDITISSHIR